MHKCGINCRRSFAGCQRKPLRYGSAERRAAIVSHLPLSISPSLPPPTSSLPHPPPPDRLPLDRLQPFARKKHRSSKQAVLLMQFLLFVCLFFSPRSHRSILVGGAAVDVSCVCVWRPQTLTRHCVNGGRLCLGDKAA